MNTSGSANACFNDEKIIVRQTMDTIYATYSGYNIDRMEIKAVSCVLMLHDTDMLRYELESMFPQSEIFFHDEKYVNLVASLGKKEGIIAHSGTGSFTYFKDCSRKFVYGGLGSYLGDEGSGYDIGLKTFKSIVYSLDGRGMKTLMDELIFDYWKITKKSFLDNIWAIAREVLEVSASSIKKLASLTKLTNNAAYLGDEVAKRILENAGLEMAKQVEVLIERFDIQYEGEFSISGGAWKNGDHMLIPFRNYLKGLYPQMTFKTPMFEPVIGCFIIYASKNNPQSIIDEFEGNLQLSNKSLIQKVCLSASSSPAFDTPESITNFM